MNAARTAQAAERSLLRQLAELRESLTATWTMDVRYFVRVSDEVGEALPSSTFTFAGMSCFFSCTRTDAAHCSLTLHAAPSVVNAERLFVTLRCALSGAAPVEVRFLAPVSWETCRFPQRERWAAP